jgi:hypothetical protein
MEHACRLTKKLVVLLRKQWKRHKFLIYILKDMIWNEHDCNSEVKIKRDTSFLVVLTFDHTKKDIARNSLIFKNAAIF